MYCCESVKRKNQCAPVPPMGWNSWDCYGASVTEDILKRNADYMAEHLKEYGYEYIVCDIQWYEPQARSTEYNSFYPLCMDEYSRLIPAQNRFPSSADGKGFAPIAEYVHNLGLKFGIHIMRGIPRQAVHQATPVMLSGETAAQLAQEGRTAVTARDIAQSYSICSWNTDMYGVDIRRPGAQDYYDSLFELYAQWGVDFVKVDDICVTEFKPLDLYSARHEIEMIRRAIDKCGRPMVLSLSPGPAVLEEAEHLKQNANMWRMTGDFWDNWEQLYNMFDRCNEWSRHVGEGCWPDCDMIPVGHIGINTPGHDQHKRFTNFTEDEQITLMTLWCMFRSPLMIGSELNDMDDFTVGILTNSEVLRLTTNSHDAHQVYRTNDTVIWMSRDDDGSIYVAFFNTSFFATKPGVSLMKLGIDGSEYEVRDVWKKKNIGTVSDRLTTEVNIHGAVLYRLRKI